VVLLRALAALLGLLFGGTVTSAPMHATTVPAHTADAGSRLASLRAQVADALAGSTARHVAWRADVAGLGVLSASADSWSQPASNNKLFVAEAALQQLGPTFHYVTRVYASGPVRDGVLNGFLAVKAAGDPVLDNAELGQLAGALRQRGLRQITGDLVVDTRAFAYETWVPGWRSDFVPDEIGPIDAFAVNENEWRQDATYVRNPALYDLGRFRAALTKAGIKVDGPDAVRAVDVSPLTSLGQVTSPPLYRIVSQMLTVSDNFVAEMVLDELGLHRSGFGDRSNGLAAVQAESRALRVSLGTDVDGSGLSYDDSETPTTFVAWLNATMRTPSGSIVKAGLPISCETGTLKDRLCGAYLTGRIRAKTGTLTGIHTLSGFTTTRSGRAVVFSFLLAGATDDAAALQHLDAAVAVLARTED
jgi:D-alanyl-D-alanine carboxypeptidase/D-alanyl-D-alanine-endopeptidase (penicillin-binding protein 4)